MSLTPTPPGTPGSPGSPGSPKLPAKPDSSTPGLTPGSHGRGPTPGSKGHVFVNKLRGEAARNFDFVAIRPPGKKTTVIEATGHLVKSALGGGIVSIHTSYMLCGLWTAVVLNVFLGILVGWLMYTLAKCAQKCYGRTQTSVLSFPDLAQCTFQISRFDWLKKWAYVFRYTVDVTIMIDLFGSCCCYQVIIARSVQQLFEHSTGQEVDIRIAIAALLIPCILICMILTLKYLAPFSIFADIIIVVVAVCTVVYGIQAATDANRSPMDMPVYKTFPGFLNYMGVCVFSMEGVGATMPIENSMENPHKMGVVVFYGMTVIVSMVMIVGFFGYWGFGEQAESPVTLNFPLTSAFPIVLKYGLAIMVYVTFALNFWVPFDLLWVYLKKRHDGSNNIDNVQRIYRIISICVITFISIVFPSVNDLIGVIGAFCLTNMGFIYPSLIQLLLDWDEEGLGVGKWRLWRFFFIFIFALALMIVGTTFNFIEMVNKIYFENQTSTK